jgi:uncharacterized protein (TIGR02757 family)
MISSLPRKLQTIPEPRVKPEANLLKENLDRLYREINRPEFIQKDPVQFPHRYKSGPDREIAAFLAATIAWGRRDLILKSAEKMFAVLGSSPYAFVMKGEGFAKLPENSRGLNIHRTFFEGDLRYFCKGLKACYTKYGSLENLFASASGIWEGMEVFRETMAAGNNGLFSKHIAGPASGSACKRINLALRWLVRREGPVDLGQWKSIPPSSLFIPLDLHVGRTARRLGLLERKANDKKAVVSLTEKLRAFCPEDPVKYDLALFAYSAL